MPRSCAVFVATALAFVPSLADACAVCGFNDDESRTAYIATTVILSALPIAALGAVIFYMRKQMQAHEQAMEEARHPERRKAA